MDPRTEQQLTNEPAYTGDPTHPGDPVYGSDPTYQAEGQRSPEQLSSEIAHTRANLAGDLPLPHGHWLPAVRVGDDPDEDVPLEQAAMRVLLVAALIVSVTYFVWAYVRVFDRRPVLAGLGALLSLWSGVVLWAIALILIVRLAQG